jgi:hypothetical protein
VFAHALQRTLRQEEIAAAHNARLQGELSREAAGLDFDSELVTGHPSPADLTAALASVARVRAAIMSCQVIGAKEPLHPAAENLLVFAMTACGTGVPDPTVESEAAWLLLKTSIACGLELLSVSHQQESHARLSLHIMQEAVEVWQVQLWLNIAGVGVWWFSPKLPEQP